MAPKIKVINGTPEEITVREGNAGIYRDVAKIPMNAAHTVTIDPNATYREFLYVSKNNLQVIISSDDFMEWKVVKIMFDENQTPQLFIDPKESKKKGTSDVTSDNKGYFRRIMDFISRSKKDSTS